MDITNKQVPTNYTGNKKEWETPAIIVKQIPEATMMNSSGLEDGGMFS
jgi:hypothetical protein